MRAVLDLVGWEGLSPAEQIAAVCGGAAGLSLSAMARTLFGGLALRRAKAKKRKAKGKGRRG